MMTFIKVPHDYLKWGKGRKKSGELSPGSVQFQMPYVEPFSVKLATFNFSKCVLIKESEKTEMQKKPLLHDLFCIV